MGKLIDLTGQRFGRLTVIKKDCDYVSPNGRHSVRWLCKCDCGKMTVVHGNGLRQGTTKSCGCFAREQSKARIKHGGEGSRLYVIWSKMKQRCYNPNHDAFERYGGRGIEVCKEWRNDFQAFRDWAMENGYRDDLTLDRTDNNKGYSPENCRWETKRNQSRNKRNLRWIEINGETHCFTEWVEKSKVSETTVRKRLKKGWTIEEALELVPRKKN